MNPLALTAAKELYDNGWIDEYLIENPVSQVAAIISRHMQPQADRIALLERALRRIEDWITNESQCVTQQQRMSVRFALIEVRAALAPATKGQE